MNQLHSNLAGIVLAHAAQKPDLPALIIPRTWSAQGVTTTDQVTYGQLAEGVARVRAGLLGDGFVEGDRVVVMFPVSIDLYVLVLALLASGMVAVFVDTGMGKERVFQTLRLSKAKGIVSVDPLLKMWPILRVLWGRKRYSVDRPRAGVKTMLSLASAAPTQEPVLERGPASPALMTFTSGSTGTPKAANRTHDLLINQHLALSQEFPANPGEVDMPCFPVVPLHNLCCGITTVMPAVDLRAPATVNPGLIVDQVRKYGVTRLTGSTAYLMRLCDELEARGEGFETITTLGAGGAPVPRRLCQRLIDAMPQARLLIIYGSTEAEPMASAPMHEFVTDPGEGYLVGRLSECVTIELVELPSPAPTLGDAQMAPYTVPHGEVGEVVVRGPHVLRGYVDNPKADAETKLRAPDGGVWHRTGDLARWDEKGRLWLVGRLSDRVKVGDRVVDPYPVEAALDALEGVVRTALITSRAGPELVFEGKQAAHDAIQTWLIEHDIKVPIAHVDTGEIPMDHRHNSKIARPVLRIEREIAAGV